jgi:hypothetical protein
MQEFQKVLDDAGKNGWELVNFQCVTYASTGSAQGTSAGKIDAALTVRGPTVTRWTSGQDFGVSFVTNYDFQVWWVFKRPRSTEDLPLVRIKR